MSGALVAAAWLAASGLTLAFLFHIGVFLPRNVAVVAIWGITGIGLYSIRASQLSLLPRFMMIAYSAPFAAPIGYLLFDEFLWWFTPRAIELQSDPIIIEQMLGLGVIGILGLLAGMALAQGSAPPPRPRSPCGTGWTLQIIPYAALAAVSVVLSWLSAPGDSILTVAVGEGTNVARAKGIGFAGAWLASYILVLVLVIDLERERVVTRQKLKALVLTGTVLYIAVVLQILQGDREVSGLLSALGLLYLTPNPVMFSPEAAVITARKRVRKIVPIATFCFLVLVGLGSARYSLADRAQRLDPVTIVKLGMGQNTWTGVLLTNLGSSYEYRKHILHFVWGRTYLDYALSLPPGVLTHAMGIERPLEPTRGGASESLGGVTGGGIHAVVIPFENFGAPGVFMILAIFGFWLVRAEQAATTSPRPLARLVWASIGCVGLFWFWYGDMNVIRAIMGALVIWPFYRLVLGLRLDPPAALASEAIHV